MITKLQRINHCHELVVRKHIKDYPLSLNNRPWRTMATKNMAMKSEVIDKKLKQNLNHEPIPLKECRAYENFISWIKT